MKLKDIIEKQAAKYDSFYLYDESCIIRSIECLKMNFPQIHFLYSLKCNSNFHVLSSMFGHGFEGDAASLGEVLMAREAGLSKSQIYYSAPGKTCKDIERTITNAVLIADSIDEIKRIQTVAEQLKTNVSIGVRINPDFTFYDNFGHPSKFGIDESQILHFIQNNECSNVKIKGIHVHLKSQELNPEVLAHYYLKTLRLAEKFQSVCGELEFVNMGSGMGIPYSETDPSLDMTSLGADVKELFDTFQASYPSTKMMIEVGRYAVCKSGVYVTKVLDRKVSHGKTYLILKNTLNGFLRPSLAALVVRSGAETLPAASEPLFTCKDAFQFLSLKGKAPTELVTLVGNLCTTADVMAEDILMPHLECGDSVVITNAGSYGAVLSPMQFSSQDRPVELFLTADGQVRSLPVHLV